MFGKGRRTRQPFLLLPNTVPMQKHVFSSKRVAVVCVFPCTRQPNGAWCEKPDRKMISDAEIIIITKITSEVKLFWHGQCARREGMDPEA